MDKLTKLILDYHCFPFVQVIKLLRFIPHIYTLKTARNLKYNKKMKTKIINYLKYYNYQRRKTIKTPDNNKKSLENKINN